MCFLIEKKNCPLSCLDTEAQKEWTDLNELILLPPSPYLSILKTEIQVKHIGKQNPGKEV